MKQRLLLALSILTFCVSCKENQGNASAISPGLKPSQIKVLGLAAGDIHTCALTTEGVRCWGQGRAVHVPSELKNPSLLTAGASHTCALTDDGIICWGRNNKGQLNVPADLGKVIQLASTDDGTCAIADNRVRCWGDTWTPPAMTNPRYISSSNYTICAVADEGVKCWGGDNYYGQLNVPPDLKNPRAVAAGDMDACALTDEGVRCWGENINSTGQPPKLINPTQISSGGDRQYALTDEGVVGWSYGYAGPPDIPKLKNPKLIASGRRHACALDDNGVHCWGNNLAGQTDVPKEELINPRSLSVAPKNSDRVGYACVIADSGVKCWGGNEYGQLNVPSDLKNPRKVAAAEDYACALTDEGLRCWGGKGKGYVFNFPMSTDIKDIGVGSSGPYIITNEGYTHYSLPTGYPWFTKKEGLSWIASNGRHLLYLGGRDFVLHQYAEQRPNDGSKHFNFTNIKMVSVGYYETCVLSDEGTQCWFNEDVGSIYSGPSRSTMMGANQISLAAGRWDMLCTTKENALNCAFSDLVPPPPYPDDQWRPSVLNGTKNISELVFGGDFSSEGGCMIQNKKVRCFGKTLLGNVPTSLRWDL